MNETIIIRAPIGASWESREVALTVAGRFIVEHFDRQDCTPVPYGADGGRVARGSPVAYVAHWTKHRAIIVTVLEVEK